jgi:hypothetical protein
MSSRATPPAWIGARKSIETYEFAGQTVPGGAYVNYSSWVSHHLAHVSPTRTSFARSASPPGRRRRCRRAPTCRSGRLADLPRHALRPARDKGDRVRVATALRLRARAWLQAANPSDADHRAAPRRAADHSPARHRCSGRPAQIERDLSRSSCSEVAGSLGSALLDDQKRVAVGVAEPEHGRHRLAHAHDLGIDVDAA